MIQLKPFNTIGNEEADNVLQVLRGAPLSGYLGGIDKGGYWVERLEAAWCETFGCKHAVAVNSATSGLLAASVACDIYIKRRPIVSAFTMSATAAAPAWTSGLPLFVDIEPQTFCIDVDRLERWPTDTGAVIVTNLFGHPAELERLWKWCEERNLYLIEDNAQAIGAKENNRYTGTIGDVGVFSLNVHKHIQAGEGGICVTSDDSLVQAMREFRNHGEMFGNRGVGLNLRMTEVTAAIACAQLKKLGGILAERIEIAEQLTDMVKDLPGITPPVIRENCTHSYYVWAIKLKDRDRVISALQSEGVPMVSGYVDPLYRLPAFQKFQAFCPVAERMHDKELAYFEVCAWSPSGEQMKQIGEAFKKVLQP